MEPVRSWKEITELCQEQYARLSRGNLWYDLELKNEAIIISATRMLQQMCKYRYNVIDKPRFLVELYRYLAVVRTETEKARQEWLSTELEKRGFSLVQPDPFSIDCVKFRLRDLEYVNERWCSWVYKDGEPQCPDEFDNNIEEYYADLGPISHIISDPLYKLKFGKHQGYTIGAIISFAPQYLLWAHHKIDKFKLSEQLLSDVQGAISKGSK